MFRRRPRAHKVEALAELDEFAMDGTPVLIDFMQANCAPCRVMDGIVDELAAEFAESAHIVKVDVAKVPGAAQSFGVKSTPTFIVLAISEKARKKAAAAGSEPKVTQRWRASGLIKKDQLRRALNSAGAAPTA